jgi:Pyridine nucleotide-disulphide oxidoreductase
MANNSPTIAIIGAGPFGLAIAAHLRYRGLDFRIFGTPMHRWRAQMPAGMFLKSAGFASNLGEPTGHHTLERFCAEATLPYANVPVSLETFNRYASAFQQSLVPMVEDVLVTALDRQADGFELRLATGEQVSARKVVIATGLSHTSYIPLELAGLPTDLLSHSSAHHDLTWFKGREVVVIGAGQSALETAALLNEGGANVTLVTRQSSIVWNAVPSPRQQSLWKRVTEPESALGGGVKIWFCANFPAAFHRLPAPLRVEMVRRLLDPAGAHWLRERVKDRFPILLSHSVHRAEARGARVMLQVRGPDGHTRHLTPDHIVAGTGYRFAAQSLPFLSQGILSRLHCMYQPSRVALGGGAPSLSRNFESSVSDLYFTGLASTYSFGPVMRFLYGAHYTAERISRSIASALGHDRSFVPVVLVPASNRKTS